MNRARHQLLARPALAGDQHVRSRKLVQPLDVRQDLAHQPAAAHEAGDTPALHVLLRERDQPLRRRAPRRFRFLPARDFGFELAVPIHDLARQARERQVRFDPDEHLLGLKGLGDVVHRATAEPAQHAFGFVLCGHEEHGNGARRLPGLELAAQRKAVAAGQDDVEQDHVRAAPLRDPQALRGVRRSQDLVPARLQQARQHVDVGGGIVDDQDFFRGHGVHESVTESTAIRATIPWIVSMS